ncbi:hypothetical protein BBK36DRAFT_1117555 [Trichoderma citrinoviride]|uniref:Thioesterase/thiol ester dehydrase-isomerase n=1 Tax=Trichoderma citrinoviride TaxID=58853 RepID=A0A2T4BBZ3_9HYPO|nr:hypothetical protein BBK36DRAFT_1117555 [Trichoderma citrinoviride]PTB66844.1 hypothetical protein BBK36DRAFT_1117555 [Trichoderma citrinoviride]
MKDNVFLFFETWYGNAIMVFIILHFGMLPFERTTRAHGRSNPSQQQQRTDSPDGYGTFMRDMFRIENTLDSTERYPLFQPVVMSTYVPSMELDMDLHNSNSTFFSDLDVCRTKLMGQIVEPVWPMDDMEIEYEDQDGKDKREKIEGRPAIILGATHTSFKYEIEPQTTYRIKSRILGWDSRWTFVGSWILGDTEPKGVIYATSLAKYVIKKGSVTVRPEQFFTECGWLPLRNDQGHREMQLTGKDKVWSWLETEGYAESGITVIRTWKEAILLMEQEYED